MCEYDNWSWCSCCARVAVNMDGVCTTDADEPTGAGSSAHSSTSANKTISMSMSMIAYTTVSFKKRYTWF